MRNNKPFQIIIAVILALMLFIAKPVNLRADDTPTMPFNSNYKYSNGVGNITIWLDYSSGVGTWETYINSSANNWMYTGWDNPIYLTFVSSNYGSNMDFHSHNGSWFVTNTGSADVFALTLFFSSSGGSLMGSSGPTASWYYSEIHINDDAFSDDNFPNEGAHELCGMKWDTLLDYGITILIQTVLCISMVFIGRIWELMSTVMFILFSTQTILPS